MRFKKRRPSGRNQRKNPSRHSRKGRAGNEHRITGKLKVHRDGYGFVLPDIKGEPDVFIPARYMGDALSTDRVLVAVEKTKDPKRDGRIVQVLERGRTAWTGVLEKKGKHFVVVNREFSNDVVITVPANKLHGAKLGELVLVEMTHFPETSGQMAGEIKEVLGEPLSEKAEMAAIMARHHISRNFPEKVEEESRNIPDEISHEECRKRVDLRGYPILTIDGLHARDFDDAVYVEKRGPHYHLWVAIADVAHYVRRHAPLDIEAYKRGTSVYFPDFAVPMLPEKLSNGLCSLKAGEDRLTLVCEMSFSDKGVLEDAWYYEGVIRSRKRGIYEEVQNFYDGSVASGDSYQPELKKSLHEMKELAHLLMNERVRRGSIDFDLPEAEIVYNQQGKVEAIVKAKRFFTHRLIEEFMIAANVAVATLFSQRGIPVPYRIHDRPDPLKLTDFSNFVQHVGIKCPKEALFEPKDLSRFLASVEDHPMAGIIHQLLLRSMKVAYYGPDNRGHFGLSLKHYCHFTSPIRRYPDLIVHRQLKTLLRQSGSEKIHLHFTNILKKISTSGNSPHPPLKLRGGKRGSYDFYSFQEIDEAGALSSQREREAMEAERSSMDLKCALFMKDHIGEKFYGAVRRVTKFGMFIGLEPHLVDGLLHVSAMEDDYYEFDEFRMELRGRKKKKKVYRVGDRLWVRVKEVAIQERITRLEIADSKE